MINEENSLSIKLEGNGVKVEAKGSLAICATIILGFGAFIVLKKEGA